MSERATVATHGVGRQLGMLAEALVDSGCRVVEFAPGSEAEIVLVGAGPKVAFEGRPLVDLTDNEPALEPGVGVCDAALVEHFPEHGRRVLSLLVGGDDSEFRRVESVCSGAVRAVLHAGTFGAAHKSRALIHTMYLTLKNAAEEIVAVAREHDIGAAEILGIINKSSGESLASQALYRMATEPAGGNAGIHGEIEAAMISDLRNALDLASESGMSGLFARRVYDRLEIKGRKSL
ncbi:MAG: hypothetical protein WD270_03180 [Acetobacterales bacterium]